MCSKIGCTTCALITVCFPVAIVTSTVYVAAEIVTSPVTVPLYLYRSHKYKKWITEWRNTLSTEDRECVEAYITGPINLENLHKFSVSVFRGRLKASDKPHIPACMKMPIHLIPSTKPSKEDFIASLNYMRTQVVKEAYATKTKHIVEEARAARRQRRIEEEEQALRDDPPPRAELPNK